MSAIIFDFDGTIADSFELVLNLFYELTGHPEFSQEQIAEFRRIGSLRKVAKAVNLTPRQIPILLIKGRARMTKGIRTVHPFPGMEDTLKALQQEGHELFVMSSNSQHNVEEFLRAHRLDGYFRGVYGGVGLLSKTGALNKVMRQNKLASDSCFYIGDEVRDILAARRAGVRAVAVAWGYNDSSVLAAAEPFAVAASPQDLLKLLKNKGRGASRLSPGRLFGFRRRRK